MRCAFALIVVVGALTGCLDDTLPPGEGSTDLQFIPTATDLTGFQDWPVAVHRTDHAGRPMSLYMNQAVPAEGYEFEKMTMIVKTVEIGGAMDQWEVHAMVKRGGGYGVHGAPGWEFLNLRVLNTGAVVILNRGDGTGLGGYSDPAEMSGTDAVCLDCHGDAGDNDYVMAPEFRIGTLP